jgi:ATP-dependent DNA helicase RecG
VAREEEHAQMSMESLRSRIAAGENKTTALVESAQLDSVGPIVCSFLNSDGGTVVCGVGAEGDIVGIERAAISEARNLELELKKAISPTPFVTAGAAGVEDKDIIVLEVPQGLDRPYVFEGAVWLRSEGRSITADSDALRAMLQSREVSSERWERQLSPIMAEDELDLDEIRATVREAEESGRFSFSDPSDTRLVLKDLAVLLPPGFTHAGDVLFSRTPARRHPQCRVQLLVFGGEKTDPEYVNNRTFEGPLVRTCRELISAVEATNMTRSVFRPGEVQRVDQPAYDADAIREGVVNAFVHRDYSAYSGGLKVSVYTDRIEIWNSGALPEGLKPSDLRRDHPSILINPDIAQVFYLRGFMERIGRGTELIAKASRRLGAASPHWRDSGNGVTLTLFSSHARQNRLVLNRRQQSLLEELAMGNAISLREYVHRYGEGVTDRQGRRDLDELVKSGKLTVEGAGRSTVYRRER